MEKKCVCTGARGMRYSGNPAKCYCGVCGREVPDGTTGDTSGGRGQLRESSVRPTADEGVREGRPSDSPRELDQDVRSSRDTGVHDDSSPADGDVAGPGVIPASRKQVGGSHYKGMSIQPAYFAHVNGLGALEANIVKYVCRHHTKGEGQKDLLKARHYIDLLLEWEYGNEREDQ